MRAISIGLVGKHADASTVRGDVREYIARCVDRHVHRGPPAKITPTYAAPSVAATPRPRRA